MCLTAGVAASLLDLHIVPEPSHLSRALTPTAAYFSMRPPSDTVSAFFACLLAKRWEDAASLVDEVAVQEWRNTTLTDTYGKLNLEPDGAPSLPRESNPLLHRLATQPAPPQYGVATVGELFAMPARQLLEHGLAERCLAEDGEVLLPWFGRGVEILSEKTIHEDIAEVTYRYVGQPEEMLEHEAGRLFQMPWKVRLWMAGGHWRMDVPHALVHRPF